MDPPADPVSRFKHDDALPRFAELLRGRKPGSAGTDDEYVGLLHSQRIPYTHEIPRITLQALLSLKKGGRST
jgi:hypothetical protein